MSENTPGKTVLTNATTVAPGEAKQNASDAPGSLWGEEKQCILAVDDVPENIEIIRNLLSKEYQVKAATKGSKAIEIARRKPQPDLILLDVMMPEMNGLEVCRVLKSDADTLQIPVIFVTGNTDAVNESEGFELGATDYISKPFNPAIIRSRVVTHLQLQKEKKKVDQLLENLFPRRIIQDIKFRGFSSPELFTPATIMFAELLCPESDFFSPDQMAHDLTDMFTVFDGLVSRQGGERIKSSCYTYVAACGIPEPNINHARIMVQAAVDFLTFFSLSAHFTDKGWKIRIGIHTGSVIGCIVGRKRYQYDIFGNDVRTAIQAKNLAQAMQLLVTEATMLQVKDHYSFSRFSIKPCDNGREEALYELTRDRHQLFLD